MANFIFFISLCYTTLSILDTSPSRCNWTELDFLYRLCNLFPQHVSTGLQWTHNAVSQLILTWCHLYTAIPLLSCNWEESFSQTGHLISFMLTSKMAMGDKYIFIQSISIIFQQINCSENFHYLCPFRFIICTSKTPAKIQEIKSKFMWKWHKCKLNYLSIQDIFYLTRLSCFQFRCGRFSRLWNK